MAIPWPVSLQQKVNTNSYQEKIGETTIRTTVDTGPVKVRRRFTRPVNTSTVSFILNNATEYTTFLSFYNTDVNGGVSVFQLVHPITGVLTNYRFTGPPVIHPLGGFVFEASMEWEAMP